MGGNWREIGLVGFIFSKQYDASKTYNINNLVRYDGSVWLCIQNNTVGITPAENDNWSLFVGGATGVGDMMKTTYDPLDHGYVDKAATVGDAITAVLEKLKFKTGTTNKLLFDNKEVMTTDVYDANNDGIVDKAAQVGNAVTAVLEGLSKDDADNLLFKSKQVGNMLKSSYDRNGDGIVDYAEDIFKDGTTELTYDSAGRLASVVETGSNGKTKTSSFTYDTNDRLTVVTEATEYRDSNNAIVRSTKTTTLTYNAEGKLTNVNEEVA